VIGLAVAFLVSAAAVLGWPAGVTRRRRTLPRPVDAAALVRQFVAVAGSSPRRALVAAISTVVALALIAGGAVAAVVAAAYTGLAGRALIRRSARRRAAAERSAALDGLAALAADLRAGLIVGAPAGEPRDGRIARLTAAVWRLGERTGAPAADLVERIEADARAADRAAASAAAQAAGAQATAFLLAALPLGGIGLGVAIGADPVHVLLHTPVGGACAVVAVLLQCGGLLWAERLAPGAIR
jgi:tight adherence protein B